MGETMKTWFGLHVPVHSQQLVTAVRSAEHTVLPHFTEGATKYRRPRMLMALQPAGASLSC